MRLLPLVLHAGALLPRWTARFSDPFPVSLITVAAGGNVTLTTSAPHKIKVGTKLALSITDALTPNAITAAEEFDSGDVLCTTRYEHGLTTAPDRDGFRRWNETVTLSGFTSEHLNGNRQLVDVQSATTFVVKPGSAVASVILTGNEKLLERFEGEVVGWHSVTAASATTLTFPTPAGVTRSYTVDSPTVVRNIRVFAAVNFATGLSHITAPDTTLDKAHLIICPLSTVRASRGGAARTDAIDEIHPGVDHRQLLLDGFEVYAVFPGHETRAHVRAIDLAQGEVFKAVLRTFYGLKIARPELVSGGGYSAAFHEHAGGVTDDNRALYAHRYSFQAPAYLTNDDAIAPWEWPIWTPAQIDALDAAQETIAAGGELPADLAPIPAAPVPFRGLDFTGILHDGMPQPLTGTFDLETP